MVKTAIEYAIRLLNSLGWGSFGLSTLCGSVAIIGMLCN